MGSEMCIRDRFPMDLRSVDSSTRIKDAGIAIRHSQGYIVSILQGPEMGWRGLPAMGRDTKGIKKILSCYGKIFRGPQTG